MKPGNLRLQGAKSGGDYRQMRNELNASSVDEALFCVKNMKGMCIYEHEKNFYIRIRNRRPS